MILTRCTYLRKGEAVPKAKYLDFGSARRVARDAGTDVTQPHRINAPPAGAYHPRKWASIKSLFVAIFKLSISYEL
jgi:hypothetical protein